MLRPRALPRWIRRMVVELKGEHPPLNPNEIAGIVYVRTGSKPDRKTVKRVLSEEPIPLRMVRRFEPYHEIPEPKERRRVVVALHADGWAVKTIAGYLRVNRDTVYQALKRWIEEGEKGLEEVLGDGWLKALKLREYAPRRRRQPEALQQVLFPYLDAL